MKGDGLNEHICNLEDFNIAIFEKTRPEVANVRISLNTCNYTKDDSDQSYLGKMQPRRLSLLFSNDG